MSIEAAEDSNSGRSARWDEWTPKRVALVVVIQLVVSLSAAWSIILGMLLRSPIATSPNSVSSRLLAALFVAGGGAALAVGPAVCWSRRRTKVARALTIATLALASLAAAALAVAPAS